MQVILSLVLFLVFGSEVFCMDAASRQQAEQRRQQQEAQYAGTQRHYAEQSAINAQRERQRQQEQQQRLR